MGITSLTQLQDVLAERVIPLLQEYFFEDFGRVSLVLTGSTKDTVFFKTRKLATETLFPGGKSEVGFETRVSSAVGNPRTWGEVEIAGLYGGASAEQRGSGTGDMELMQALSVEKSAGE
jgi:5-methylcytosine-specific restriction protein B